MYKFIANILYFQITLLTKYTILSFLICSTVVCTKRFEVEYPGTFFETSWYKDMKERKEERKKKIKGGNDAFNLKIFYISTSNQ